MHDEQVFYQPAGVFFDILGTRMSSNGRSCIEHDVCGQAVQVNDLVRIRCVQVVVNDVEKTVMEARLVVQGLNTCRIGFLPGHCVQHRRIFDGKLAQITEIYQDQDEEGASPSNARRVQRGSGCIRAVIVNPPTPPATTRGGRAVVGGQQQQQEMFLAAETRQLFRDEEEDHGDDDENNNPHQQHDGAII
jgi:hypothetical protein